MVKLKINLNDSVAPPVTEVKTELIKEPQKEVSKKGFKHKVPSDWVVKATNEGIEANCAFSGESFKGTIVEFNEKMRG